MLFNEPILIVIGKINHTRSQTSPVEAYYYYYDNNNIIIIHYAESKPTLEGLPKHDYH